MRHEGHSAMSAIPAQRLRRLLRLLAILSAHHGMALTADDLARRLGVAPRTVLRDLQILRDAGVPIAQDDAGGYLCPGAAPEPGQSAEFTPGEQLAVQLGLALVESGLCGEELSAQAEHAGARLRNHSPDPGEQAGSHHGMIELSVSPDATTARLLTPILRGIVESRWVRLAGLADNGRYISFLLQPHQVRWDGQECLALGRSSWHRRNVALPLRLISHVELLDDSFAPPPREGLRKYARVTGELIDSSLMDP